jgi:hypothetical protein
MEPARRDAPAARQVFRGDVTARTEALMDGVHLHGGAANKTATQLDTPQTNKQTKQQRNRHRKRNSNATRHLARAVRTQRRGKRGRRGFSLPAWLDARASVEGGRGLQPVSAWRRFGWDGTRGTGPRVTADAARSGHTQVLRAPPGERSAPARLATVVAGRWDLDGACPVQEASAYVGIGPSV